MKAKIIISLLFFLAVLSGISAANYAPRPHVDQANYDQRLPGQLVMVGDEGKIVWYNRADDSEWYWFSIRASNEMVTDVNYIWPISNGEPNSVLMTPGGSEPQLVWATVDSKLVDVNSSDPNIVNIELPTLTPGSRVFVDANGFPLYEDNANAYFDDVNDFAGFALGHITGDPKPNNYIQVYKLLNFDPDLYNTSVGWSDDDNLTGPNNLRIGYHAGRDLTIGLQNAFGGRGNGENVTENQDNAFWGFETGKYVKTDPVRDEAFAMATNGLLKFFDVNFTELNSYALEVCISIDIDGYGKVVSSGDNRTNPILCIDADMNTDDDFYQPANGIWGYYEGSTIVTRDIAFTDDSQYLYVHTVWVNPTPIASIYKFDNTTGAEVWRAEQKWHCNSITTDSADNLYFWYEGLFQPWDPLPEESQGIIKYNSGGTPVYWYGVVGTNAAYVYDVWVDEDLDLLLAVGYDASSPNPQLLIYQLDGSSYIEKTFEQSGARPLYSVKTKGNYIYVCGQRQNMGGYSASVFKVDVDGDIIEYYDTGDHAGYIFFDHNDQICVKGFLGEDDTVYVFDDDLTLLNSYSLIGAGYSDFGGTEAIAIPYATNGIAEGSRNTAIGSQALAGASAGAEPNEASAGGYKSMFLVESGDLSTGWGAFSLGSLRTGSRDVALGPYAGYRLTTEDDKFVVDSRIRDDAADEIDSSILYGHMADDANDQWLNINADVNMPIGTLDVNSIEVTTDVNSPIYYIGDSATYITQDGSDNMTFTDAVVGTKTLQELGSPTYKIIDVSAQSEGDLHLSDGSTWGISKAMITSIRIVTSSTDWDLWVLQNDNGYAVNDATVPMFRRVNAVSGNATLMMNVAYEDEDASGEVHLYYLDNSGANTADIYIIGYQMI